MKRKCKMIEIDSFEFIRESIDECLRNKRKTRPDIVRLLKKYPDLDVLAKEIQEEIRTRNITLVPIKTKIIWDVGSGKEREIGIQDIRNQIYDYIAVRGLADLKPRIGLYQCASIKKRGQLYGLKTIQSWLQTDLQGTRYVLKCDVKKFYPSVSHEKLLGFLNRLIKNDALIWLIGEILKTFGSKGLSIGSFLSQTLANLYMSELYHYIEEECAIFKTRRGVTRRYKLCSHILFYMDDVLALGANKSNMKRLAALIQNKLSEMGLEMKEAPRLYPLEGKAFIDMLGFKIYRNKTAIRKRNWKRIRRSLIRYERQPKNICQAKRIASYWGFIKYTNSCLIRKDYQAHKLFNHARRYLSFIAKEKLNENGKYQLLPGTA